MIGHFFYYFDQSLVFSQNLWLFFKGDFQIMTYDWSSHYSTSIDSSTEDWTSQDSTLHYSTSENSTTSDISSNASNYQSSASQSPTVHNTSSPKCGWEELYKLLARYAKHF